MPTETSWTMELSEEDNNRVFMSEALEGRLNSLVPENTAGTFTLSLTHGSKNWNFDIYDFSRKSKNTFTIGILVPKIPAEVLNLSTVSASMICDDNIIKSGKFSINEILVKKKPQINQWYVCIIMSAIPTYS